jgi:DNA-binding CsgD family transcriptional regulator
MARPQPQEIVGRSVELAAIDRVLDRLADEPAALVLEGRPGIGKTTVWREMRERAAARSFTILSCHPVEAETKLAFASLADLLEPVAESMLPALPAPQRLALEVALMRASPPGTPPSARAVATALLSALRLLAAATPVVVAIDDAQWLDRASADALAFALRRIGRHRIGVVASVRVGSEAAADPLALDRAFEGAVDRVRLAPLALGALHHVIHQHLGQVFPRPTLRRIADASEGNPLFALELARVLIEAGVPAGPGAPLPVPETLTSLLSGRLGRLPGSTRDVLGIAAALSAPTVSRIRAAAGGHVDAALARAVHARVIDLDGDRVRFTHPLLASAVYAAGTPAERRALHRRLADVIVEPEERTRHLALAAVEPDAEVADALDAAALLAWRRGAPDTAGVLQEEAARLTPSADRSAAGRRRVQAAEHFVHAGDRTRARALLERVLGEGVAPDARAHALRLLGQIRGQEESFADAITCFDDALACATEPRARVAIQIDLAAAIFNAGDVERALGVAHAALADAERLDDAGLLADALCIVVVGAFISGRGSDRANLARALALEDRTRAGQLELRPSSLAGIMAVWEGRLSEGYAVLREVCDWATERGEESGLAFLLCNLSWVEWWRGNFDAAIGWADEARVIAEQSGSETMRAVARVQRGRAHAARGDVPRARADLGEARRVLVAYGYVQAWPWLLSGEAVLELSRGDAAAAARAIEPLVALADGGTPAGLFVDFAPDAVDALVHVGEVARAETLLTRFAERARALDRPWALASTARCRSLVASARGDLDGALVAAVEATASSGFGEMPVEEGRALLVLGQVRRRRGERRLAREALERARAIFARIGAVLWAERVREELGRIPIRRGTGSELTPTEERVAALAAAGRTNAEVAAELFMSPKTVEANLTRIYGKLAIRSRAELGARMVERRAADPSKK